MTKNELRLILESEGIHDSTLNGFSFTYGKGFAILESKIPLSLARRFYEGVDNQKLRICLYGGKTNWHPDQFATGEELSKAIDTLYATLDLFDSYDVYHAVKNNLRHRYIKKLESEGRLDELFILYYHIHTEEGLRHVIRCIRESGIIKE